MFRKLHFWVLSIAVTAMVVAGSAFAAPGDPPAFDATDMEPAINDYASTLLTGIVALLGVVLVAAAAFTLVRITTNAVRKYLGRSKAAV